MSRLIDPPAPNAAFRWSTEPWGHALRCRPLETLAQHAFTTRQLPLRPRAGQSAAAWNQATASVGADLRSLVRVKQVHGRGVLVVRPEDLARHTTDSRPEADAIVSNAPGAALAVQVADCVPILLAEREGRAVAAVHAGWRGTCAGIAVATVEALTAAFDLDPVTLVAAVGPSIGPCCYDVGPEVLEQFRRAGATDTSLGRWFTHTPSGWQLNLWAAAVDQLQSAGVPAGSIHVAGLCTKTHSQIFDSYRVDGERAGRMAAIITLPPKPGAHQC